MKRLLAIWMAAVRRRSRAPSRPDDDDLVQRLREAGL
jgi:hypothetical protein